MNYAAYYLGNKPIITRPYNPQYTVTQSTSSWTRPAEWLTLPTLSAGEQKMVGLLLVSDDDVNYLSLLATGSLGYTVDWGDGIIENFASGVVANHIYTYSDIDISTEFDYYGITARQAIVTVTPQSTGTLLTLDMNKKYSVGSVIMPSGIDSNWLDLSINGPNLTAITLGKITVEVNMCKLRSFKIGENSITSFASSFRNMAGLVSCELNALSAKNFTLTFQNCRTLKYPTIINSGDVRTVNFMFNNCQALIDAPLFDTSKVTDFTNMYGLCYSLRSAPAYDVTSNSLSSVTMASMFSNCFSLTDVELMNTSRVTSMDSMFTLCYSLVSIPAFDTSNVTTFNNMFLTCPSLVSVPLLNTSKGSIFTSMFSGCYSLLEAPLFNLSVASNVASMFANCYSLVSVPSFNMPMATSTSLMFQNCYSLEYMPPLNMPSVTDASSMFNTCQSLQYCSPINLPNATTLATAFRFCYSLLEGPEIYAPKCANFTGLFQNCNSITSIPEYNFCSGTTFTQTFASCTALESVGYINLSAATNTTNMFSPCISLKSLSSLNTINCLTFTGMFSNCPNLVNAPDLDTSKATNLQSVYDACPNLIRVPELDFGEATGTHTGIYTGCFSLPKAPLSGMKVACDVSNIKLSKTSIEYTLSSLHPPRTTGTITISIAGNPGTGTSVVRGGFTNRASNVILLSNTGPLSAAIGLPVIGNGSPLTTPISAAIISSSNTVSLTSHGLSTGDIVSFNPVLSAIGLSARYPYYVINETANSFQISITENGPPLTFLNNGIGAMRYNTIVTAINPNVSITVSRPMTLSAFSALSFRDLNVSIAILKGWTISG